MKLAYAKEVAQAAADARRMMHKDMVTEVRAADGFMHQWRQLIDRYLMGKNFLPRPRPRRLWPEGFAGST